MSEPIISVSGLRGIVGQSLDPLTAVRYTAAFLAGLPPGPIVVTRDGRGTGPMLADAVRSAVCALGRPVLDGAVAATPTTGVLVRRSAAAGGIQISASHNPPEYNGLKLFSAEGRVIEADEGGRVLERYHRGNFPWCDHRAVGSGEAIGDTLSAHLELVLAGVDVPRIRQRAFRVLLDSNHGAGSLLGSRLLERLGCETVLLGDVPDGNFAHPAEPTAENLANVSSEVTRAGADIGFCQDPDADRLAVIDEQGRYLGEEYTLALCLDHVLRTRRGPVVTNCATSLMCADIAARYEAPFHRSAVGEANVTAKMHAVGAVFGGEGNGGPIDPKVGYVRDSFVGMALILDAMAARAQPVGQMADELPRYAICKTKFDLAGQHVGSVLDALQRQFADADADLSDGLRLDWPGRWLLVRASNTEPILRAIAEAGSPGEASSLCEAAGKVIAAAGR